MRILILMALLLPSKIFGQTDRNNYFALTFENDAIALPGLTDKYYTNGIRLEYMGPRFTEKHYLLNKLLIKLKKKESVDLIYGSFFGQNMYTPVKIDSVDIQVSDRPFSGWLYGGVKSISTDTIQRLRFTSELYLGVIGPYAFAGETQTFIHKISGSTIPTGWHHQIDSDLGINYVFRLEKMFAALPKKRFSKFRVTKHGREEVQRNYFEMIFIGEANVGTVFNNRLAGLIFRAGYMTPYFKSYNFGSGPIIKAKDNQKVKDFADSHPDKRVKDFATVFSQIFLFAKPQIRLVYYNAMLEGGLFNRESEHKIAANDLEHFYAQLDYGLGITIGSLTINYYQSIRSREFSFSSKDNHYWGGINLIFNY